VKEAVFHPEALAELRDQAVFYEEKSAGLGERFTAQVQTAVALAVSMSAIAAVRAFREYRQMTQDQLARASGLSKPFLSQIEGRVRAPSLAALRRLAAALDVPVGALTDE